MKSVGLQNSKDMLKNLQHISYKLPTFLVLGGYGEMGRIIVHDLFKTSRGRIIVAGRDSAKANALARTFKNKRVIAACIDVTNKKQLAALCRKSSVVINATQYNFNLNVMAACESARKPYLDLGGLFHMTKRQLAWHARWKRKGLLAILGCGATPGITNIMAAYGTKFLDSVKEIHVKFAGKDFTNWHQPFVLPYAAETIFDEFSMKAARLRAGRIRMIQPMSDETTEKFPSPFGTVRCGSILHSELATFPKSFPKIRECSFQAGFQEDFSIFLKLLAALGFTKKPWRAYTKNFLNQFLPRQKTAIRDLEILRVTMHGTRKGKRKKIIVDCIVHSVPRWNAPAGTVDTAVPPSIIAQMITGGRIAASGVLPPEQCVQPEDFFEELKKRKIEIYLRRV